MTALWVLVSLLHGLPFVVLKIAVDQRGAVDDLSAGPKRFTCAEALDEVHRIRSQVDAVLVGVGTVVRDDPSLTVRRVALPPARPQPLRVVLDPRMRTPPSAALNTDGHDTIFFTLDDVELPAPWRGPLADGVRVLRLPPTGAVQLGPCVPFVAGETIAGDSRSPESGQLSARHVLQALKDRGVTKLLVEGGPSTALNFLREKLVDQMILVRASVVFKEPVPSLLTDDIIAEAGLRKANWTNWGVDEVTFFAKDTS